MGSKGEEVTQKRLWQVMLEDTKRVRTSVVILATSASVAYAEVRRIADPAEFLVVAAEEYTGLRSAEEVA